MFVVVVVVFPVLHGVYLFLFCILLIGNVFCICLWQRRMVIADCSDINQIINHSQVL